MATRRRAIILMACVIVTALVVGAWVRLRQVYAVPNWERGKLPTTTEMNDHLRELHTAWKAGNIIYGKEVDVCGETINVDIVYDIAGGMDGFAPNVLGVRDIYVRTDGYALYLCKFENESFLYFRLNKPYVLHLPFSDPQQPEKQHP